MQNMPSQDPRDIVAKAAMHDAVTIAGLVAGEFQATYSGGDRQAYLATLATWLADFGGVVEEHPTGATATFAERQISIHFGPVSGHR